MPKVTEEFYLLCQFGGVQEEERISEINKDQDRSSMLIRKQWYGSHSTDLLAMEAFVTVNTVGILHKIYDCPEQKI